MSKKKKKTKKRSTYVCVSFPPGMHVHGGVDGAFDIERIVRENITEVEMCQWKNEYLSYKPPINIPLYTVVAGDFHSEDCSYCGCARGRGCPVIFFLLLLLFVRYLRDSNERKWKKKFYFLFPKKHKARVTYAARRSFARSFRSPLLADTSVKTTP